MGSVDRDDNRIFEANFSTDGSKKLGEIVKEKLKEFMGEYSDDTFVVRFWIEYSVDRLL